MGYLLHSLGFGRWGGVFSPFVHLALVAVLLASESLPCPHRPLSYSVFLFFDTLSLFYMEIARASLCVRACVRLYIHV